MGNGATHDLTLIRFIRAPRERVFDAFVQAGLAVRCAAPGRGRPGRARP